jgi:hypothetical protein
LDKRWTKTKTPPPEEMPLLRAQSLDVVQLENEDIIYENLQSTSKDIPQESNQTTSTKQLCPHCGLFETDCEQVKL